MGKKFKQEKQKIADELLSKTYTLEQEITVKDKWDMLKLSDEQKELFVKIKKIQVYCKNFTPCIVIAQNNLNGLNTFENAERKGLTKDMTNDEKQMLKKLSNNVSFRRLLVSTRNTSVILLNIMAISNALINIYSYDLYKKIQPEETFVFFCLFSFIVALLIADRTTYKSMIKQLTSIAYSHVK